MTEPRSKGRCAIYARKSSEEGLDQAFNSLHAQREACEAYILSQKHEGWQVLPGTYDDGGFSGGNMERPGLKKLLADISASKIDTVVVYKVDRLTRSLSDFARIVESFDSQGVSFVSVTQQFNTTSSMGRLTLNVLLSFAQFEREVTGERIRDKIAASKKKGMWMGGPVPLGYDLSNRQLIINPAEAETVRSIFARYLALKSVTDLQIELEHSGVRTKQRVTLSGREVGGVVLCRGALYHLLGNPLYVGKTAHKGQLYDGMHNAIIDQETWDRSRELLRENAVKRRRRKNLPSGRMLHGKLASEDGRLYTPTHSTKGGRRYFYYTLLGEAGTRSTQSARRLPAAEIEARVIDSLGSFLEDAIYLAEHFSGLPIRDTRMLTSAAAHRVTLLRDGVEQERAQLIGRIVSSVVVQSDALEIEISKAALRAELLGAGDDDCEGAITLRAPCHFAKRGNEVRLILESGAQPSNPNPAVVKAVAQAKTWYEWITKGEVFSMRGLAKRTGFNENYVSRILDLAVLSPEITEAILRGDHDPSLTVAQLTATLEVDWTRQRLPRIGDSRSGSAGQTFCS
jgi:DNA invertase Pin-like site-specific DNA recombinase